jgi:hypothetical protein
MQKSAKRCNLQHPTFRPPETKGKKEVIENAAVKT